MRDMCIKNIYSLTNERTNERTHFFHLLVRQLFLTDISHAYWILIPSTWYHFDTKSLLGLFSLSSFGKPFLDLLTQGLAQSPICQSHTNPKSKPTHLISSHVLPPNPNTNDTQFFCFCLCTSVLEEIRKHDTVFISAKSFATRPAINTTPHHTIINLNSSLNQWNKKRTLLFLHVLSIYFQWTQSSTQLLKKSVHRAKTVSLFQPFTPSSTLYSLPSTLISHQEWKRPSGSGS